MDFSLYIHFPWCVRKCPYCDFNSHQSRGEIPEAAYVNALLQDLENDLPLVWGRRVASIFMGGGTPSLFSPVAIDNLLSGIRALLPIAPNAEITLEANPGTVEQDRFAGFRAAGINRLSIGIQSFNDQHLISLGRIHDAATAIAAVQAAQAAGFTEINLDLMFNLPGQTLQDAERDLQTAFSLEARHLSYYQLTLEPNTLFYRSPPQLPGDDMALDIQNQGQQLLAAAGYHQYEVSAYARESAFCRHNLNYWRFGDYLGIGAGAHGKITDFGNDRRSRYAKHRHPEAYMDALATASFISDARVLEQSDLILEFMMNALRLNDGFTESQFTSATGLPLSSITDVVNTEVSAGLLQSKNGCIKTTALGARFLDDVLQRFF